MAGARNAEFQIHPQRDALYNELHIRPFHPLSSPQQISHLASCAQQGELSLAYQQICELCHRYNVNQPAADAVSFYQDFGDFSIHWERHVEFYSLTVMQAASPSGEPFEHPAINLLPDDWLKQLPGQMVAAFHLIIDNQQLDDQCSALCRYFEGQKVMVSAAKKGKAQFYTAFKLHGDGYGRFIIRNNGMDDEQMGQLARRLMEMETYRLLALIALPIARQIGPQLVEMDQQLANILTKVNELDSTRGERNLLSTLTELQAQLENHRAATTRRFSATRAYHELVHNRLASMQEESINGHLSLQEFMGRRLTPALRTCESLQGWMDDLSKRIERASDLLRTRVNLNLQEQNRSLLSAMNRRSQLQFRLQETVEGLSIVAVSYYMVGLIGYLLAGLPLEEWGLSKKVLTTCSVPLVLLVVATITHRIKHRLIKNPLGEE
ncbi:Uncharacterized membrane-anchored protein [Malonomonas rubra DSM 5091]|uniref:Uncharacterized membrane-anchored protein n=1 Tax=Malonomonas rubra DSM 5091 TaxID=1122189 RepID=A0A1M6BTV9_MALRU|nr:DUF3422 domain-containing protein [Malonomonas rubra]SHI52222.1 Uncharacterized membrane-anchored protein [Malonomonas rubra DSM 5091]